MNRHSDFTNGRQGHRGWLMLLIVALALAVSAPVWAQVNGAIFTTVSAGTTVNGNIYPSKEAVYLNGGPQNQTGSLLSPDGFYYFQVTDPSGAVLLSKDPIQCRVLEVKDGRVVGRPGVGDNAVVNDVTYGNSSCYHTNGTYNPANSSTPIQLFDYLDTPNPGGVYKAWITPVTSYNPYCVLGNGGSYGFCHRQSKTDNFKIRKSGEAYVTVCKFNDANGNHTKDQTEAYIPNWPITLMDDRQFLVTERTDADGCVTFQIPKGLFTSVNDNLNLFLKEGTLGSGWVQTAPTGSSVVDTAGRIKVQIKPGESLSMPDFGNQCPEGSCAASLVVTKTAYPIIADRNKWSIDKSVKDAQGRDIDGQTFRVDGSMTLNYTVSVSHQTMAFYVTGMITVSNPGTTAVTGVAVTDTLPGAACVVDDGANVSVPAGGSVELSYTCTYGATPALGLVFNTATATWAGGVATGCAEVDFLTATRVNLGLTGDTTVTVHDPMMGSDRTICIDDVNPTLIYYSRTVSVTGGTCETFVNTATFTTDTTHSTGSASTSVEVCSDLATPTLTAAARTSFDPGISKKADRADIRSSTGSETVNYTITVSEANWAVSGTVTVTNPNSQDVTAQLATPSLADATCTVGAAMSIPAGGGSQLLTFDCRYSVAPPSTGTINLLVNWSVGQPARPQAPLSTAASFTFAPLVVMDAFNGGAPTQLGIVNPPAATTTFTDSRTVKSPAGTCTTTPNLATLESFAGVSASASVKVCTGAPLVVTKTAVPTFTRTYNWTLGKTVDRETANQSPSAPATFSYTITATQTGYSDSGQTVTGTITISNPNDWEAVSITGLSDVLPGAACTVAAGDAVVPAKGEITRTYTCALDATPTSTLTNTVTATWDAAAASTADASASGTATATFGAPAVLTNKTVEITDAMGGETPRNLGTLTATDAAPYTSNAYTYTRTFPADPAGTCTVHDNTATLTGGQGGVLKSSSKSVKVCVGAGLTVSKTAALSFTRTYSWTVDKSVDKTRLEAAGGTGTFAYTVRAMQTGYADSAQTISGSISISNPNDWEAITLTSLTDGLPGAVCTINGGDMLVPAKGTITRTYACTLGATPTNSLTNTVTALWDAAAAATTGGSASGSAVAALVAPATVVNRTIDVTDSFNGGTAGTLGTLTATDAVPYTSQSYTYSRTVSNVAGGSCVAYPNVATIRQTGQTATQSVTLCNTATGGLTMGFWQNKNGQAIITGGATSQVLVGTKYVAVCNSGIWLRSFAPFQDLPLNATCGAVGSYVTGIIKAANASGASMNAMLKAQMLASALDVFFSDPLLGGNRIGAAQPIGGVKIDLTQVCSVTSGCSPSSLRSSSAAFGGASAMKVLDLLLFQNSVSNAGGTIWYGQNKSVQEMAKNVFDAINNAVAYIAP